MHVAGSDSIQTLYPYGDLSYAESMKTEGKKEDIIHLHDKDLTSQILRHELLLYQYIFF